MPEGSLPWGSRGVLTSPWGEALVPRAWLSCEWAPSLELAPVTRTTPHPPASIILARSPGMAHSRYWQRSPRKPGRHRHWGWLPWLTVQVLLLAQ